MIKNNEVKEKEKEIEKEKENPENAIENNLNPLNALKDLKMEMDK